jgi:hypothetical protein
MKALEDIDGWISARSIGSDESSPSVCRDALRTSDLFARLLGPEVLKRSISDEGARVFAMHGPSLLLPSAETWSASRNFGDDLRPEAKLDERIVV